MSRLSRPGLQKQKPEVRSQNEEPLLSTLCSRLRAFRFLLTAWVLLAKQKTQSLWGTRLCATCCSAETQGGYARYGPSPLTSRAPNPGSIVFDNLIGELGGTVSLDKRNGIG